MYKRQQGIYTLTAGFTEWWGYGRDMSQTISYTLADGTEKTVQGDAVSFGERGRATGTVSFILPEDATVTYTVEMCIRDRAWIPFSLV